MSDPTSPEGSEPAADAQESADAGVSEAPASDADAADSSVADAAGLASGEAAPVAPRKRRGLIAILVLVGIVVVLGIVAVIAESIARQQASALIADQVRSTLQLEADHPVDVTIEGVSVLWQALSGRIDKVTVDAADVSFGELVGDLTLIAEGTPIDTAQPADSVQAVYRVAEADVAALAGFLAGSVVNDVQLDEREIRFQTAFSFFGVDFSVGLGVTPSAQDGQLAFTPSSVVLGDERLDAADLQQQFGPIVEPLLTSRLFCVAQYLPEALALTAVQVGDEQLVVVFGAENVALGGPEFSTLGTCS